MHASSTLTRRAAVRLTRNRGRHLERAIARRRGVAAPERLEERAEKAENRLRGGLVFVGTRRARGEEATAGGGSLRLPRWADGGDAVGVERHGSHVPRLEEWQEAEDDGSIVIDRCCKTQLSSKVAHAVGAGNTRAMTSFEVGRDPAEDA